MAAVTVITSGPHLQDWGCGMTLCRFIFGLPLWQKNALDLSKQILKDTKAILGDSVIGYELGNEVSAPGEAQGAGQVAQLKCCCQTPPDKLWCTARV
jgi:hypothetical protein